MLPQSIPPAKARAPAPLGAPQGAAGGRARRALAPDGRPQLFDRRWPYCKLGFDLVCEYAKFLALSFRDSLSLPFEHDLPLELGIVSIIFPVGLAVSKFIFKMRSPTSLAFSVSMILTKSLTLRAKRSSLQTTSVSRDPLRHGWSGQEDAQ
jgi:hypothetical protein